MIGSKTLKRFIFYALVGATGTGAQYVTLIALVRAGMLSPPVASCVGALVGAVINYILNHRFTFQADRNHSSAAPRFFAVAAIALLVNWVGMAVLSQLLSLNYILAQMITTVAVLGFTYIANATWSFRARAEA